MQVGCVMAGRRLEIGIRVVGDEARNKDNGTVEDSKSCTQVRW
jgi:hypothetical protein